MCLHHKECATIKELVEHLAQPSCMASGFVTQFCRALAALNDEEAEAEAVQKLAIAPDSQLDKFYRDQAARLTAHLPPVSIDG